MEKNRKINNRVKGGRVGGTIIQDSRVIATGKRRNQLASTPNCHTTKCFSENVMAIEIRKTKVKMNKPIYLGMSILDINKTLFMNFGMIILNQYQRKAKLCYMNTNGLVIRIKSEDFYEDIVVNDVEKWFDTSNYEEDVKRPLPIGKNKKVIGLFKDESGGKIVIEFARLRAKTWGCLRMMILNIKKLKE